MLDNKKLYRRILFKFSENERNSISDILGAIESSRIEDAKKFVHSLKGVSGNIGATALYQLLIEVEKSLISGAIEEAVALIREAAKTHESLIQSIELWKASVEEADLAAGKTLMPAGSVLDREAAEKFFKDLLGYLELYDTESIKVFDKLNELIAPFAGEAGPELEKAGNQIWKL